MTTKDDAAQMIKEPMWFIGEILMKHEEAVLEIIKELEKERKRLCAENARLTEMCDKLLNHCDKENGECSECGRIVCPYQCEMHFHHDGCPACCQHESEKIK